MSSKHRLSSDVYHTSSKRPKSSAENANFSIDEYNVGWICALPCELAAAKGMLDEIHENLEDPDPSDNNTYILGRIHNHNVVIGGCPAGIYGNTPAATVAKDMLRTFPSIKIGLMVGIGGGAPTKKHDIRLGDVVISQPSETNGGVIQFDRGKTVQHGEFQRTGALRAPPTSLLIALGRLQAEHEGEISRVALYMTEMLEKSPRMKREYSFQDAAKDCLYNAEYDHADLDPDSTCDMCDQKELVSRGPREDNTPHFHYGTIGSSNQVVKHGRTRETLRAEHHMLCFEMEAAGLMDFPCLMIRGISDYSDSHKNKVWQKYAAATAAAYAKELLSFLSAVRVSQEKAIAQVSDVKLQGLVSELKADFNHHTEKQDFRYENKEHEACHQAFKLSTYDAFKDINPNRVPGTCVWALKHPKYLQWLKCSKNDLLWISADPGCGKSVLARFVVDNELRNSDTSVCHYFFKDNEQQDGLAMALCALLHQLFSAQPHLLKHAIAAWKKNGHRLHDEIKELWDILVGAATDPDSNDVVCVLDAMDECRDHDRQTLLTLLSKFYSGYTSRIPRTASLKFLVTSRPYDDIELGFQSIPSSLPVIRLSGKQENDKIHEEIDLVIRERVAALAKSYGDRLSLSKKEELEQWLLGMEHRTYLWLHLAFDSIANKLKFSTRRNSEAVELTELPSSVNDAYEKLLSKIKSEYQPTAKKILHIIVGARRPLFIDEMAAALGLATQPEAAQPDSQSFAEVVMDIRDVDELLRLCGLFIFTNHSRIYLIHQTAKEFLIQTEIVTASSGWKYSLNPVESEKLMARICVKYLLLKDFNDMNPISIKDNIHLDNDFGNNEVDDGMEDVRLSDSQVLLHYSARHWPSHVYKSMITKTPFLMEVLRLYQLEHNRFRVWFPIFWLQQHNVPNGELNDIRLAAYIGHDDVLRSLVNDENMNVGDLNGKTPLFWAVKGGHEAIVAILLDQGVDINASCYAIYFDAEVCLPQTDNGDALTLAAEDGNVNFVKALIEKGANLNAGALQKASEKGHMDVVELLVEMGTNINEVGRRYGSALQQASSGGNLEIAKFLLEKGANVEGPGGKFVAALQAASFSGREEIVKLLLAKGADINAKGGFLGSALQAASSAGEVETVKLLLANGADVNAEGGMPGRALDAVCGSPVTHDYHCIEIVRLLIAKGADVNAEGGFFGNAVHAASYGGRVEVVKFLLENGADVEARGGKFANALQASCADNCGRGTTNDSCTEIVRLLVAKGADVNAEGGIFGSALQAALFYAQHGAVEVLLDNGANVTLMMKGRGRWKWNGLGDGKEWIANVIEKYGKERRYEWDWDKEEQHESDN